MTPDLTEPVGKKKLGVALVGLGNCSNVILGKALKEAELCYLAGVVFRDTFKSERMVETAFRKRTCVTIGG